MVQLISAFAWEGRLILAGKTVALPPAVEAALLSAGNAQPVEDAQLVEDAPPDELPIAEESNITLSESDTKETESEELPDEKPLPLEPEMLLGRGVQK